MKIVVCVKPIKGEVNPFDACALEAALKIEDADITVISMGRPNVESMLQALTRLGINRAILLTDNGFAGADTLATSYTLSLAIKKINPDLVICGRQSVDGDTAQVGPSLSQMLDFSLITNVMEISHIDKESNKITCVSRIGDESANLPALITMERVYTLRFPSIRSRHREVEVWTADDIAADRSKCGLKGSPTRVLKTYESSLGKRKCTFIQPSELQTVIEESRLKSRLTLDQKESDKKFDEVWVVGEEVKEIGLSIAENVKVIERQSMEAMAEMVRKWNPKVILWNADIWGRRNAPVLAAMLKTGLCADCTHLETDGEKLYMYRPTYGGSMMAKIECRTKPQMATVRTITEVENEIIVAGGKGTRDSFDLVQKFAEQIGAGLGASRSLVDAGLVPYEMQIGLTGKNINPKVYIACGISGAVHHTCAIEQAGTIIAINKDKNARIFDYADYGIVADVRDVLHYSNKAK
jgi:electron transfer flavoprotein alpha subunit